MALSSLWPYGFDEYQKVVLEEGDSNTEKTSGLMIKNSAAISRSASLGSPTSANSNEHVLQNHSEEVHSLINFKGGYDDSLVHGNGSLVSFQQNARVVSSTWWGDTNYSCNNQWNPKCSADPRLLEDLNSFQKASIFNSATDIDKLEKHGDWFFSQGSIVSHAIQESAPTQDPGFHKRPNVGESLQAQKKPCSTANRKSKIKSLAAPSSKDPQSIAAKIRRERISERLKILQDLVPNGSKVDLVTMLEKAISYVKFLQLQVKVLATDEFWPTQGGKAPDISQVKEAIDAILSSQRDRTSSSSSK